MTISATYAPPTYTGNGVTTAFSTVFPFRAAANLVVTKITIATGAETVLVLNADYTVSGGSGAVGTVTVSPAISSSYQLRIERVTPRTQPTDFQDTGEFPIGTLETRLDDIVLAVQEVAEDASDAIALAEAAATEDYVDTAIDDATTALEASATAAASSASTASTQATAAAASAAAAAASLDAILNGGALADAPVSSAMQPVVAAATLGDARTELGLGSAAVEDTSFFLLATDSTDFEAAGTALLKSDNLASVADAATARTNLGLTTMARATDGTALTLSGTTLNHDDTAVTPGTYGSATKSAVVVVDQQGHITGVTEATITSSGKVAQVVRATWSTYTAFTNTTPLDNTIPQSGEGAERFTASITPINASSTLLIDVELKCTIALTVAAGDDGTVSIIGHLHRDSDANAIGAAIYQKRNAPNTAVNLVATESGSLRIHASVSAGSTSATTFKVRSGKAESGTVGSVTTAHNGVGGALLGGVMVSSITITEILP